MRRSLLRSCTMLPALNAALAFFTSAGAGGWCWATDASPDQVVAKMSEKLNVTDQQKTQITPIIADRQQKMEALRAALRR